MHRKWMVFALAVIVVSWTLAGVTHAENRSDALEQGFLSPPDSAKPRVWWHWTGGNVTKEGITRDLEWMKRVGIGGAQLADIGQSGGQIVDHPIIFFTPEWFDAVRHAAAECDRLGLEMSIFSSSGWSETGGPWVKPEQAMKKLVWSETGVTGPRRFSEKLLQPPSANGTFGGLRGLNTSGRGSGPRGAAGNTPAQSYYGDSAVIAFRTPPDEMSMVELNPKVTSSGGDINSAVLMDDVIGTSASIAAGRDGIAWVQYEFAQPIHTRAVTLIAPGRGVPFGQIQTSDDGLTFRSIVELPGSVQYRAGPLKTYAFPETTTRFVRVTMTGAAPGPDAVIYQTPPTAVNQYPLSEFIVHTGARVDRWEEKAGFNFFYEYQVAPTPPVPAASLIQPGEVAVLTSKMDKDGTLHWDVPEGKWTILRMGYSLTGHLNTSASRAGSGLEVDKLSRRHVEAYFHGYMDPIEQALGSLMGKSLRYMMMDSWEAGSQNWTEDMVAEFAKRRGYDPTPYLPALAGRVVGSADVSDRFLWDFRRTIADLVADAHYGTMADMLKQKGMGLYGEAAGVSMEIMEDTLLNKSKVEVPMGEFWLGRMHPPAEYYVDVRMAAAAAHVYGKQFVAAESFTGGGYDAPATYKNLADYWFAQGVNRIVFHSSAQQPLDTKPGNTMVGTHFNRNITWAEQARPMVSYLARNSYLLSQGLFVADFAYLLNEGPPSSQPFWGAGLQPALPEGYDYDTINADVLLNRMTVNDQGRMVLPDGMSYRILVLPQVDRMRPELLRKIRDLVIGGVTVVGPRPVFSPSLQGGYPQADMEVQALANELWGDLDGVQRNKHYVGKGLVVWGLPLREVIALLNIPRDAEFAGPLDSSIVWIHRRVVDADIYFVANRRDQEQEIQARFRVDGKEAEIWHPDSGAMVPAGYTLGNGRTMMPLHLDPRESVFVVFRKTAATASRTFPSVTTTVLARMDGPWKVTFPPKLGAPEKIELTRLESLTVNADEGVRFFSGTASYAQAIEASPDWFGQHSRIVLDLGEVADIAEVVLNGNTIGTLWKPPYVIDVTGVLKAGTNQLQINVTNEWTNRIAGDRAAAPEKHVLALPAAGRGGGGFGGMGGGRGGNTNLPLSGLLGPVRVVSMMSK